MPPRSFWFMLVALALLIAQAQSVLAQVTVQQPVFGVNSVTTTVSVPDRGRAHLGSISRARDSRTHFGPFRPGTNTGLDREHSGMSVGVTIHDFEAMDQYLLSQGTIGPPSGTSQLSASARNAWNQLEAQHGGLPTAPMLDPLPTAKSDKYWQLGQKAERAGNLSVARMHYRIAGKYGSEAAKTRLAQWDSTAPSTRLATSRR